MDYHNVKAMAAQGQADIQLNRVDTCPECQRANEFEPQASIIFGISGAPSGKVISLFRCRRVECGAIFAVLFTNYYPKPPRYLIDSCLPAPKLNIGLPDSVNEVSSDFVEIYSQAQRAESAGLHRICGPGYRKALEFLIKDYCIGMINMEGEEKEKETQAIKGKLLSAVITDHIDDPRIQRMATGAAWLGNDETHYERRWTGHDLHDVKELIRVTAHFIEMETLEKKYQKELKLRKEEAKSEEPIGE